MSWLGQLCSHPLCRFAVWPYRASRLWSKGLAQALAQLLHFSLAGQKHQDATRRQLPVDLAYLEGQSHNLSSTVTQSMRNLFAVYTYLRTICVQKRYASHALHQAQRRQGEDINRNSKVMVW